MDYNSRTVADYRPRAIEKKWQDHWRDTRAFESIFDDLEGIGPARRRAILNHFGSAEAFVQASREELEGVPGLPSKTAGAVYAQLHKAGRG